MHHIKKFRRGVRDAPPNPLVDWGPHFPTPRRLWHLVHFFGTRDRTPHQALAQIDAHGGSNSLLFVIALKCILSLFTA